MRRIFLFSLLAIAIVGMLTVPAQAFNVPGQPNHLLRPGNPNQATMTGVPTTAVPTTAVPTTAVPTTAVPTTAVPTTAVPTTAVPTTAVPTTAVPTTAVPTTAVPTTAVPTTAVPTMTGTLPTAVPTTAVPTTAVPTMTGTLPTATATGSALPTATGTAPTMTPSATFAPGTCYYIVQPGDTLSMIAQNFGTNVYTLAAANNIPNINHVFVGEVLYIVGGVPYYCPYPYPYIYPTQAYYPPTGIPSSFILGGEVANLNANTISAMRSSRMTWVKYQVQTDDLNAFNLLTQAKAAGFKVLFTIVGDKTKVLDSAFQDTYATYAGALAKAGADGIEVWTEENLDSQWPTGQISAASYVTLLRKAYVVIKGVNTNTLVITGAPYPTGAENTLGVTTTWNDDHFYAELATYGATSYADCIGVHYTEGAVSPTQTFGDPRDNYPTRYFDTMLTRVLTLFPSKQVCFTALGYLSPEGYGSLPADLGWATNITAAQQAQWLGQAVGRARSNGHVAMLIVFNVDFATYDSAAKAGYAILRPQNTCAACAAIAAASPY